MHKCRAAAMAALASIFAIWCAVSQKERTEARLETLLLDGLNSGEDIPITPEFWEKLRTDLSARRAKKKSS